MPTDRHSDRSSVRSRNREDDDYDPNNNGEEEEMDALIAPQFVKQAFDQYAEGGRYMSNQHVGAALRSLGLMTPDDELEGIIADVIAEGLGAGNVAGADTSAAASSRYYRSVDIRKFTAIAHRVQAKEKAAIGAAVSGGIGGANVFKPTERELIEYQQCFRTFDVDNTGYVPIDKVGLILHQIGLHTNESELKVIKVEMDRDATGMIKFDHFLVMVSRLRQDECSADELLEAFTVFDPEDTGVIEVDVLLEYMQSMCEIMTTEDIKELIYGNEHLMDARGMIDYRRLIWAMVKNIGRDQ